MQHTFPHWRCSLGVTFWRDSKKSTSPRGPPIHLYMAYIYMAFIWHLYGIYMAYMWHMYGICMAYIYIYMITPQPLFFSCPNHRQVPKPWRTCAGCPGSEAWVQVHRLWRAVSLVEFKHVTTLPSEQTRTSYFAMERSTIFLMGKLAISMAVFNSYVSLPEGKLGITVLTHFDQTNVLMCCCIPM